MQCLKYIGIFLVLMSASLCARGEQAAWAVETVVTQQSSAVVPHTLLIDAWRRVLVRATGRADVLNHPSVQEAVDQPEWMLKRFEYRERPEGDAFDLKLTFDASLIRSFVERLGQSLWVQRPVVVILWPEVTAEQTDEARTAMIHQAQARGFDLRVLALDPISLEWLRQAQERHASIDELRQYFQLESSVKLFQAFVLNESSQSWALQFNDLNAGWVEPMIELHAKDLSALYAQGVNALTEFMVTHAPTQAAQSNQIQAITLNFEGVKTLGDYIALTRALRHFGMLSSIEVNALSADRLQVNLDVSGGLDALSRAFLNDMRFKVQPRIPLRSIYWPYRWKSIQQA
ncbi:MAG: hypothetical protein CMF51_05605 [Legionellales bacterium]|nr:hypothetical protein [Legionellales bacterium]|tara:strand:+ start:1141 stop:2175 length:1035 start_codon:yes stop_codon:yes gene_type:complete